METVDERVVRAGIAAIFDLPATSSTGPHTGHYRFVRWQRASDGGGTSR
jgi:hypothetical protein